MDSDSFMSGAATLEVLNPGDFVGQYRIIETIGEGGFGIVYKAEQLEPLRRLVALKLIKPGLETRLVMARFDSERQALALMDHPNIAKVFEAGVTETGRPYFAMEFIDGEEITKYCDKRKLTIRDRLSMFTLVCSAVNHAHQKGVIHRDIKPSNILVTENKDGQSIPVLIDFGIAKALQGQLSHVAVHTLRNESIGTPEYISPEQAEMGALDIDTRADIYSMGVLLYQLVSGTLPFDTDILLREGLNAMWRILREQDPKRPSTRINDMALQEATTHAVARGTDPRRLKRLISGDIDWIVLKCLEKDRRRRYETAVDLAADIRRHLQDEPVLARPPSNGYRMHKVWIRNKAAILVGFATLLLILVGIASLTFGYYNSRKAIVAAQSAAADSDSLSKVLFEVLNRRDNWFESPSEMSRFIYQTIQDRYPTNSASRINLLKPLAYTLNDYKRGFEALPILEEIGRYHSLKSSNLYNNNLSFINELACAQINSGQHDAAYALLKGVDEPSRSIVERYDNPVQIRYWNLYAEVLSNLGKLEESISASRKANARATFWYDSTDGIKANAIYVKALCDCGRVGQAIAVLERLGGVVELNNVQASNHISADALVEWTLASAHAYQLSGNIKKYSTAIDNARELAEARLTIDDPLRIEAMILGNDVFHGISSIENARRTLEAYINRDNRWELNQNVADGLLKVQRLAMYSISAETEDQLNSACQKIKQTYGPNHRLSICSDINMGYFKLKVAQQPKMALETQSKAFRQAIELFEKGHPIIGDAFVGYLDALTASGDWKSAAEILDRELITGGKIPINAEVSLMTMRVLVLKMWETKNGLDESTASRLIELTSECEIPAVCERIAKVLCMFNKPQSKSINESIALAERASDIAGPDSVYVGWNAFALALAQYRNGDTQKCLETLMVINDQTPDRAYFAQVVPILTALCMAKEGKIDVAVNHLQEVAKEIGERPPSKINTLDNYWGHDRLIMWMLFDEANTVVSQAKGGTSVQN